MAKDNSVEKLIDKIKNWYFEKEGKNCYFIMWQTLAFNLFNKFENHCRVFETLLLDEGLRLACGLTLQAMSRYSPDVMKRHTAKALPAVFFAMHEKKTTGSDRSLISPFITGIYRLDVPQDSQKLLLVFVVAEYIYRIIWFLKTCVTKTWSLYSQLTAAQVLMSPCGRKFGSRIHQVNGMFCGSLECTLCLRL